MYLGFVRVYAHLFGFFVVVALCVSFWIQFINSKSSSPLFYLSFLERIWLHDGIMNRGLQLYKSPML